MAQGTLRRSDDRVIAGVCSGIADYYGWPAGRVRLLYLLITIFSAGFPGVVVYLVLWFLMPPR